MTPVAPSSLFSHEAFAALGAPNLVYVRPIKAAEILASTPASVTEDFRSIPTRPSMPCTVPMESDWRYSPIANRPWPPPWRMNWRPFRCIEPHRRRQAAFCQAAERRSCASNA